MDPYEHFLADTPCAVDSACLRGTLKSKRGGEGGRAGLVVGMKEARLHGAPGVVHKQ